MLDRKFVVENIHLVKKNCVNRGSKADVDKLIGLGGSGKRCSVKIDQLNQQANAVSKSIGQAKDAAEREACKEEGRVSRAGHGDDRSIEAVTEKADGVRLLNLTHADA
jgi:seryl-tRNA synthetase